MQNQEYSQERSSSIPQPSSAEPNIKWVTEAKTVTVIKGEGDNQVVSHIQLRIGKSPEQDEGLIFRSENMADNKEEAEDKHVLFFNNDEVPHLYALLDEYMTKEGLSLKH